MGRGRIALLVVSVALVGLVLGGGFAARVGAADDSPFRKAVLFSEVLSLVLENYVDPVDADRLLDGAYEGMLSGLDARSAFLTPQEVAEWNGDPGDRSAGPGLAVLKAFGGFQIVAVEEGSPAADAGLLPGDQIRAIDGRELTDLSLDQGLRLLLGAAGTEVRLDVVHTDDGFRREEIALPRVGPRTAGHRLAVRDGVAIVTVSDPSRVDVEKLGRELRDAASGGADRLLVDLRNGVDADPRTIAPIAGLFARGDLLRLRTPGKDEPVAVVRAPEGAGAAAWSGPVAVLVNGATAGAGEALAGVLREVAGARVYGESTYGLGSEPRLFPLPDGSGLLLAVDVWEWVDGGTWDRDGVTPDDEVRGQGTDVRSRLDDQLRRTLQLVTERTGAEAAA